MIGNPPLSSSHYRHMTERSTSATVFSSTSPLSPSAVAAASACMASSGACSLMSNSNLSCSSSYSNTDIHMHSIAVDCVDDINIDQYMSFFDNPDTGIIDSQSHSLYRQGETFSSQVSFHRKLGVFTPTGCTTTPVSSPPSNYCSPSNAIQNFTDNVDTRIDNINSSKNDRQKETQRFANVNISSNSGINPSRSTSCSSFTYDDQIVVIDNNSGNVHDGIRVDDDIDDFCSEKLYRSSALKPLPASLAASSATTDGSYFLELMNMSVNLQHEMLDNVTKFISARERSEAAFSKLPLTLGIEHSNVDSPYTAVSTAAEAYLDPPAYDTSQHGMTRIERPYPQSYLVGSHQSPPLPLPLAPPPPPPPRLQPRPHNCVRERTASVDNRKLEHTEVLEARCFDAAATVYVAANDVTHLRCTPFLSVTHPTTAPCVVGTSVSNDACGNTAFNGVISSKAKVAMTHSKKRRNEATDISKASNIYPASGETSDVDQASKRMKSGVVADANFSPSSLSSASSVVSMPSLSYSSCSSPESSASTFPSSPYCGSPALPPSPRRYASAASQPAYFATTKALTGYHVSNNPQSFEDSKAQPYKHSSVYNEIKATAFAETAGVVMDTAHHIKSDLTSHSTSNCSSTCTSPGIELSAPVASSVRRSCTSSNGDGVNSKVLDSIQFDRCGWSQQQAPQYSSQVSTASASSSPSISPATVPAKVSISSQPQLTTAPTNSGQLYSTYCSRFTGRSNHYTPSNASVSNNTICGCCVPCPCDGCKTSLLCTSSSNMPHALPKVAALVQQSQLNPSSASTSSSGSPSSSSMWQQHSTMVHVPDMSSADLRLNSDAPSGSCAEPINNVAASSPAHLNLQSQLQASIPPITSDSHENPQIVRCEDVNANNNGQRPYASIPAPSKSPTLLSSLQLVSAVSHSMPLSEPAITRAVTTAVAAPTASATALSFSSSSILPQSAPVPHRRPSRIRLNKCDKHRRWKKRCPPGNYSPRYHGKYCFFFVCVHNGAGVGCSLILHFFMLLYFMDRLSGSIESNHS